MYSKNVFSSGLMFWWTQIGASKETNACFAACFFFSFVIFFRKIFEELVKFISCANVFRVHNGIQ